MAIDSRNKRASAGSLLGMEILPVADGTIGTPDRLQVAGLYAGIAASAGVIYTLCGPAFLFTAANWSSTSWYFEAYVLADTGTAYVRLYDVSATAVVSGSTVSTAAGTYARQRSGSITLTDGNEYRAQVGTKTGDQGSVLGIKCWPV
jgi:hypothetical protein